MKIKNMEVGKVEEVMICSCSSLEHQMVIRGYVDEEELYVNFHLYTYDNFFKRLWHGLKYAFGYKSRFGAWDSIVLTREHLPQMKKIVEHLEIER